MHSDSEHHIENVSFKLDVQYKQTAKTIYNIDFLALKNDNLNAVNKLLFVSGIIRESFLYFGKKDFECAKNINIVKIEVLPNKTENIISVRLVLAIETTELLTDIDDFEEIDEMMSNIKVNDRKCSDEKYSIGYPKE
jgi:hypothetical protein